MRSQIGNSRRSRTLISTSRKRLGPDGRISEFSYNWTAKLLRRLGFRTLEQVERCIRPYDDDGVSRVATGGRSGQTTRFEDMLLAGMGDRFISRHAYAGEPWWAPIAQQRLERLRAHGIPVGDYDPQNDADATAAEPAAGGQAPTRTANFRIGATWRYGMSNTVAAWDSGHAYDQYVGRWSQKVATEFLRWLALPPGLAWADVGCGTGALASPILTMCEPSSVYGIDSSERFVSQARRRISAPQARFETGDATHLPWNSGAFDVAVSGLVLNFVQDHESMTREMARVTKPGGRVAAYVWDYAGGMRMMRHFWDAAIAVSPNDRKLDQAERFPFCQPRPLQALFERTGLKSVTVRAIDIPTVFQDFNDYWNPFLGKTGAAPTYLASVDNEVRERIRLYLKSLLASTHDGPIELTARAWGVQGVV